MSEKQISQLAGMLVIHQRDFGTLSSEDAQWVIQNPKDAISLFTGAVKNRGVVSSAAGEIFRFTVDYGLSLEQMIAAGQYDWKNSDITAKRFPIKGTSIVEYEARYFHFNRNISSENAIQEIEQAGWSLAKIEHVLSHGKTFPEEQRKFPIVCLGSVASVYGSRGVPYLRRGDSRRDLYLVWFDSVWDPVYRFLAVRKVSGS